MSINSKDKGTRGERELAGKLREYGYDDARRGQQYCGANGDADVVGLPGIHIEVKRTERFKDYDFIDQARRDAMKGELPTVMCRKNHSDWLVVMRLDDWIQIYREYEAGQFIEEYLNDKFEKDAEDYESADMDVMHVLSEIYARLKRAAEDLMLIDDASDSSDEDEKRKEYALDSLRFAKAALTVLELLGVLDAGESEELFMRIFELIPMDAAACLQKFWTKSFIGKKN